MNYDRLIYLSTLEYEKQAADSEVPPIMKWFPVGAKWMYDALQKMEGAGNQPFPEKISYNYYGCLKYGVCIFGTILAACFLLYIHWWLFPLPVLVFYYIEIHFLFLFPMLVTHTEHPIWTGIKLVYHIGWGRCLLLVLQVAFFMVAGLFKRSNRTKQWYLGCMAILIWYNHEVRNRI